MCCFMSDVVSSAGTGACICASLTSAAFGVSGSLLTDSWLPSRGTQNTQNCQYEVGNHTLATEPRWSLMVGVLFWCVPCVSLFLTDVSAWWLYLCWMFEDEVTDIHPRSDFRWTGHFVSCTDEVFFWCKEWSYVLGAGHHICVNEKKDKEPTFVMPQQHQMVEGGKINQARLIWASFSS